MNGAYREGYGRSKKDPQQSGSGIEGDPHAGAGAPEELDWPTDGQDERVGRNRREPMPEKLAEER